MRWPYVRRNITHAWTTTWSLYLGLDFALCGRRSMAGWVWQGRSYGSGLNILQGHPGSRWRPLSDRYWGYSSGLLSCWASLCLRPLNLRSRFDQQCFSSSQCSSYAALQQVGRSHCLLRPWTFELAIRNAGSLLPRNTWIRFLPSVLGWYYPWACPHLVGFRGDAPSAVGRDF